MTEKWKWRSMREEQGWGGGGVTYALRLDLLGDGRRRRRTAGGGREATLYSYTTQQVQQYLSIRTFHVNTQTHTQSSSQQVRRAHTPQRWETERDERKRESKNISKLLAIIMHFQNQQVNTNLVYSHFFFVNGFLHCLCIWKQTSISWLNLAVTCSELF